LPDPDPILLAQIGEQIRSALARSRGRFVAEEMVTDAMEDALGAEFDQRLNEAGKRLGGISVQSTRNVAIAAFAHAAIAGLAAAVPGDHEKLLAALDGRSREMTAKAVRAYLKVAREDARRLLATLDRFDG
jgi:DNA-binding GntR family transcriptional regulator